MGQRGLSSGWYLHFLISSAVIVGGKFPLSKENDFIFFLKDTHNILMFFSCFGLGLWGLPGDIKKRETNTVFDENSEGVHIHWFTVGDKHRDKGTKMTLSVSEMYLCGMCVHSYILMASFSAGHHPSISHMPWDSLEFLRQAPVITPGV